MKRFKNSLIAVVMGVVMGMTLIGSTVAYADEPCNHSYGVHLEQECYQSSYAGTHNHDGQTCVMTERLYHNYGCCNRCGYRVYVYNDTVEIVHSVN